MLCRSIIAGLLSKTCCALMKDRLLFGQRICSNNQTQLLRVSTLICSTGATGLLF
jgi:hypothetical protein